MFIGMSVGVNVLVARFYGAKREKDLFATIHTAMAISIVGGILLTIVGCVGAPIILGWMQTPPELLRLEL